MSDISDDQSYLRLAVPGLLQDLSLAERGWRLVAVDEIDDEAPPQPELNRGSHLQITISHGTPDEEVHANYAPFVGRVAATAEVASQLQDAAVELLRGEPVPACPGHGHPLSAVVLDDQPFWVCPVDQRHHSQAMTLVANFD